MANLWPMVDHARSQNFDAPAQEAQQARRCPSERRKSLDTPRDHRPRTAVARRRAGPARSGSDCVDVARFGRLWGVPRRIGHREYDARSCMIASRCSAERAKQVPRPQIGMIDQPPSDCTAPRYCSLVVRRNSVRSFRMIHANVDRKGTIPHHTFWTPRPLRLHRRLSGAAPDSLL